MTDQPDEPLFAMQTRCHRCLKEQYSTAVVDFSIGKVPCGDCGQYSEPMSIQQWRDALRATRESRRH